MEVNVQKNVKQVEKTVEEYQDLFFSRMGEGEKEIDWAIVQKILEDEAAWTIIGAQQIIKLIRDYGAFILRNAYALSIVLGCEDGEQGL